MHGTSARLSTGTSPLHPLAALVPKLTARSEPGVSLGLGAKSVRLELGVAEVAVAEFPDRADRVRMAHTGTALIADMYFHPLFTLV